MFATAKSNIVTVEESTAARVTAIVELSFFKHPRTTNPMAE